MDEGSFGVYQGPWGRHHPGVHWWRGFPPELRLSRSLWALHHLRVHARPRRATGAKKTNAEVAIADGDLCPGVFRKTKSHSRRAAISRRSRCRRHNTSADLHCSTTQGGWRRSSDVGGAACDGRSRLGLFTSITEGAPGYRTKSRKTRLLPYP